MHVSAYVSKCSVLLMLDGSVMCSGVLGRTFGGDFDGVFDWPSRTLADLGNWTSKGASRGLAGIEMLDCRSLTMADRRGH